MSISKKLKELIVAFGGADDPKKISGRQIDRLIGELADAVNAGDPSERDVVWSFTLSAPDREEGLPEWAYGWEIEEEPTQLPDKIYLRYTGCKKPYTLTGGDGIWSYNVDFSDDIPALIDDADVGLLLSLVNPYILVSSVNLSGKAVEVLVEKTADEPLHVTATLNHSDYSLTDVSASFQEVGAARMQNRLVEFVATDSDNGSVIAIHMVAFVDGVAAEFIGIVPVDGELMVATVVWTNIAPPFLTLTPTLPAATQSDAGKVLTVKSDGKAGWETPT